MSPGFVRLSRKFFDNFLWQEERELSKAEAWLDCVRLATYQPTKRLVNGELIEVPRGGIVASERFLSDRWKWSRTKVRAFLDLLESENMISRQKNHVCTIVLLCKFEQYNTKDQTSEEPPKDQRETKLEEGKEGELEKEKSAWPSLEQVTAFGASLHPPQNSEFCLWWWNSMEAVGWIMDGQPVRKWKAAFHKAVIGTRHAGQEKAALQQMRNGQPQKPKHAQV